MRKFNFYNHQFFHFVGLMHQKNSEDAQLREQCHGALWEIMEGEINFHKDITCVDDLKKPEHKRPQAPVQESHVMISYQWDVQPRVLGLRDMLKDKGYNIWIDVEKMGWYFVFHSFHI